MTLSFLALLVIPALKLSDKGLFNANTFSFTDVCVQSSQLPPHGVITPEGA
jgi:adenine deaminase